MKNANRHLACGTCILALLVGLVATPSAQAQTFRVLSSFPGGGGGQQPLAGLVLDGGFLYGTTGYGGAHSRGSVFKVDRAGNLTIVYSFTGGSDGSMPEASLIRDAAGNLYGTTAGGGDTSCSIGGSLGCGVVFKLDATGTETVLHTFTGEPDGSEPVAGLVRDSAGNLYGTTLTGGIDQDGVVFKLDTTGTETLLHTFTGYTDGEEPFAPLVRDAAGNLYGTTYYGGIPDYGTVFKVDMTGTETVLYTFAGGTDGAHPLGGLVMDSLGNLYGTTLYGGIGPCVIGIDTGCGTVFKVDAAGTKTLLHMFASNPDGALPFAGLIMDAGGNLYSTTERGGDNYGTVFKLDTTGKEVVLHRFIGGAAGENPESCLFMDAAGSLYGTTYAGGTQGQGTVFVVKP